MLSPLVSSLWNRRSWYLFSQTIGTQDPPGLKQSKSLVFLRASSGTSSKADKTVDSVPPDAPALRSLSDVAEDAIKADGASGIAFDEPDASAFRTAEAAT